MKKLLAVLPAFALVTACTSAPIAKPSPAQVHAALEKSITYKCDNSAEVVAIYGDDVANIKVTAPTLNLNQTALLLKRTVAASGVLYTTQTTDGKTIYDWHTKGNEALFSVTHAGADYDFSCQAL